MRSVTSLAAAVATLSLLGGCLPAPRLINDAADGDVAAVKADLAANAPIDESVGGETALGFAAANGRLDVVRVLLAAGARVDVRDNTGATPLLMAAAGAVPGRDYPGVITALIAAGAGVNVKDKFGGTPLTGAAINGEPQVVPVLAAAGENLNESGSMGMTPLSWAAWNGNLPVLQALIDAGADVNRAGAPNGEPPLSNAAEKGRLEAVQLLIKAGADVNPNQFETPLWAAANNGNVAVVQALLDAGADVNGQGTGRQTPLVAAQSEHHDDVAARLIQHGGHV
jgi:ankyrin repeat protein